MRPKCCSLMMRVLHPDGRRRYYPAVVAKNGQVKPFHCRVAGKAEHFPDGFYYLRYRDASGKRCLENVGNDVLFAGTARKRREYIIAGEKLGIKAPTAVTVNALVVTWPDSRLIGHLAKR